MSEFLNSILPSAPVAPTITEPRSLLIYSDFKVGKSKLASDLSLRSKTLWLDYENGSEGLPGVKINVLAKIDELNQGKETHQQTGPIKFLTQLLKELAAETPRRYDIVVHDKLDNLEDWCVRWATLRFKQSVIGKNFTGDSVLELPEGGGWMYLRDRFAELWNMMVAVAPRSVFFTSLRMKSVGKETNMVESKDLDLYGKVRKIAAGFCDAPGYLWRGQENGRSVNYLSFKSAEQGAFCGCRIPHLEGRIFKISERLADGTVKVNWHELYPSLFPKETA